MHKSGECKPPNWAAGGAGVEGSSHEGSCLTVISAPANLNLLSHSRPTGRQVYELLQARGASTLAELAIALGVGKPCVHAHLKRLVGAGLVRRRQLPYVRPIVVWEAVA